MKPSPLLLLGLMLSTVQLRSIAADSATNTTVMNYQKEADGAGWGWDEYQASPFYGISQAGSTYDIVMANDHLERSRLTFKILRDGKEVYTWRGHVHTVFRIQEDRLYYALFETSTSGGEIVAVDLLSGKELWKSPLVALGTIEHFAYSNLMRMDANLEIISVFGNESMGRYFEIKDANTGKTVGHKIFPKP